MSAPAAISAEQAASMGLRPLTRPYKANELWMLANVNRDLGAIPHAAVEVPGGLEIWRTNNGWQEHRK